MAEKVLRITLDIALRDLPEEKKNALALDMGVNAAELSTIEDVSSTEVGTTLVEVLPCEAMDKLLWEGSDLCVEIHNAKLISAQWIVFHTT